MNLLSKLSTALSVMVTFSSCNAQIKNAKTENVKIYGNCSMCEETIETAGNLNKVAKVDWNKDSKVALLTYDSIKTNQTEILKRIALAGYDSDEFLAPDDVYAKLPECCQYDRVNKATVVKNEKNETQPMKTDSATSIFEQEVNELKGVFDNYFSLKDALVNSDQSAAGTIANELLANIAKVKMEMLSNEEHIVWMKEVNSLKSLSEKISNSTDLDKQRNSFMDLSETIYDLVKVSKQDVAIYFQNCPMYNDGKGANWLSKENTIKNPYYGSQMLSCGKTIETIK